MAGWRNAFGRAGRPYRRLLGAAAAAGSAAGVYIRIIRPRRRQRVDLAAGGRLPGDGVLSGPVLQYTRTILVSAPARDVWPFLNRVGHGRAGWYVFDQLGNPGGGDAGPFAPALQELDIGELLLTGSRHSLRIKEAQPNEWMLWADGNGRSTWLWLLEPIRLNQTRLLVRGRFRYGLRQPGTLAALPRDAVDWATMRRCLLTIRDRSVVRSATRLGKR